MHTHGEWITESERTHKVYNRNAYSGHNRVRKFRVARPCCARVNVGRVRAEVVCAQRFAEQPLWFVEYFVNSICHTTLALRQRGPTMTAVLVVVVVVTMMATGFGGFVIISLRLVVLSTRRVAATAAAE